MSLFSMRPSAFSNAHDRRGRERALPRVTIQIESDFSSSAAAPRGFASRLGTSRTLCFGEFALRPLHAHARAPHRALPLRDIEPPPAKASEYAPCVTTSSAGKSPLRISTLRSIDAPYHDRRLDESIGEIEILHIDEPVRRIALQGRTWNRHHASRAFDDDGKLRPHARAQGQLRIIDPKGRFERPALGVRQNPQVLETASKVWPGAAGTLMRAFWPTASLPARCSGTLATA